MVTLHPNRGTQKSAGHLGGFLNRWCKSEFLIESCIEDRAIKRITLNFEEYKFAKGDATQIEDIYIKWDENSRMMVNADEPPKNKTINLVVH